MREGLRGSRLFDIIGCSTENWRATFETLLGNLKDAEHATLRRQRNRLVKRRLAFSDASVLVTNEGIGVIFPSVLECEFEKVAVLRAGHPAQSITKHSLLNPSACRRLMSHTTPM